MKRILCLVLVLVFALSFVACAKKEEAPAAAPEKEEAAPAEKAEEAAPEAGSKGTIGYIIPGAADYYSVSSEVMRIECEKAGYDYIELNSEGSSEKELANIEDLISKGVKAILVLVCNGESAQRGCKLANDAGIPIIFVASEPNEGEGKPDAIVSASWDKVGDLLGKHIAANVPGSKIISISGVPGQNISDLIDANMAKGLAENDPDASVEEVYYGEWSGEKAMAYTQDVLTSGREVDVLFYCNEGMARGGVSALKEAGVKPGDYFIASCNGSDDGVLMMEEGYLNYTVELAPTTEAYLAIHSAFALADGKEVKEWIDNPAIELTPDNIKENRVTWDPEEFCSEVGPTLDLDALIY